MLAMANGTVRLAVSEILDKLGMSTAEFAEKAGITYATALSIRRGTVTRIEMDTILKICNALDVNIQDIIIVDRG